ncbi:MAG: Ppx/GppA phosphatase family protein [Cyclobacteriaceae bacterium]
MISKSKSMKLAAVDIGSNAIRLQITRVLENDNGKDEFKKLESIRFPLRLGKDTFQTGEITFRSEAKFINLMETFRNMIDLYEADDFYGCATSAMRDAANGQRILDRAYQKSGLAINLISGDTEADILNKALYKYLDHKKYILIDVGGGSTEVNVVDNKKTIDRASFKLGSVRNMQGKDSEKTWEELSDWIKQTVKGKKGFTALGTGGNIRSLRDFIKGKPNKASYDELIDAKEHIDSYSVDQRMTELGLRNDRADVIPYASEIYLNIMKLSGCENMKIPDVGLKDGIIQMMYERNS